MIFSKKSFSFNSKLLAFIQSVNVQKLLNTGNQTRIDRYIVQFAKHIVHGKPFCFGVKQMITFRDEIKSELLVFSKDAQ